LEFAVGQLRWSLERPLVYGERDWAVRVHRALHRLAEALEHHVEFVEPPGGWFAQFADPHLLPLTEEAQQVARLCQEHILLRGKIRCLAAEFRNGLLLFSPHPEEYFGCGATEGPEEAHAFRLFSALDPCVGDLLALLVEHLAAEESLLQTRLPPAIELLS
jgi:hypothetical protein